ncbi:MAG: A/G-specific adenine glycosylase [Nanoarchaeota archaeon]
MDNDFVLKLQTKLLSWYHKNKRDLPWRRTSDPYKIWISEAILQQTRIDQGTPYYERFVKQFPTVQDLAKASLQDVLKMWEGLGYYSRARNLHKAAQIIVNEHQGKIPQEYVQAIDLPGFGPYTTAAVLSIAYNQDHAVLDGNVIRVLSRVFAIRENPNETVTKKKLWEKAQELLPLGKARDYNQAVMELGALICSPQKPSCESCPVKTMCQAYKLGIQEQLPVKSPKKEKPHYEIAVGLVEKSGKVLLIQRPEKGLLGGMWEFPGGKREKESLVECCRREIQEKTGLAVKVEEELCIVEHVYSHFSITLHAHRCTPLRMTKTSSNSRWVLYNDIKKYPIHTSNQKVLKAFQKHKQQH